MLIQRKLRIISNYKLIDERYYSNFNRLIKNHNKFSSELIDGSCKQFEESSHVDEKNSLFSIIMPPPNVTGNLHLGHALSFSLQDTILRSKRMMGNRTVWAPGYDHAGIATQVQVEKLLQKRFGKDWNSDMINKTDFVNLCNDWSKKRSENISCQIKSLGLSPDWNLEYFTLNTIHSRVVTAAFIELHKRNKIFRDNRIINWSCFLKSTISDIEIESRAITGESSVNVPGYTKPIKFGIMHRIAYKLENNSGKELVVSTTRPETIPADVCLAVHPKDSRFSHFIGEKVKNPVTGEIIPVIAVEEVDPELGTGVLKVTPSHSLVDFQIGKKHGLKLINVIDKNGNMENINCLNLEGVPRFIARDLIINHLCNENLHRGFDKNHAMTLPICARSGDVVEYMIRPQWFFNIDEACDKAIEAIKEDRIKIQPSGYVGEFLQFLQTKEPWCISRQLKWGHSIPAFLYENETTFKSFAGLSREEIMKEHPSLDQIYLKSDLDVLDTWFSSSLIPLSLSNWPHSLNELFPSSLLVTGYDIIPLWVCRMMIMSLELVDKLPFHNVLLHGMICDSKGLKMSKSKGNVIDPMELIGTHYFDQIYSNFTSEEANNIHDFKEKSSNLTISKIGSDAVRLSLLEHDISGHKIKFDLAKATAARNFMQKMWQTIRFVFHNWDEVQIAQKRCSNLEENWNRFTSERHVASLNNVQKYILYHLANLISVSNKAQNQFIYHPLCISVRDFWVNNLCAVFLEWCKSEVSPEQKEINLELILLSINTCIHLIHPVLPQITEVIWHNIFEEDVEHKSIGNERLPGLNLVRGFTSPTLKQSASSVESLLEIVSKVNHLTQSMRLSRSKLKANVAWITVTKGSINERQDFIQRMTAVPILTEIPNQSGFFLEIDNSMMLEINESVCDWKAIESYLTSALKKIVIKEEEIEKLLNDSVESADQLHEQLSKVKEDIQFYKNKLNLINIRCNEATM